MSSAEMSIRELVELYVERKRALGYEYGKSTTQILYQMSAFLEKRRVEGGEVVSREAVLDWVAHGGSGKPRTAARRATAVRGFCSFLAGRGLGCYVLPVELSPCDKTDYVPYIFTKAEIAAVAEHLDAMAPSRRHSPFQPITLATMFRTIYGCGLRAGEARRILLGDVDMDRSVLSIRNTKNGESRYVPMSDSLRDSISRYLAEGPPGADDPHRPLFPSPRTGGVYDASYPCKPLGKCFAELGILTREGKPPVVHSLRHTFAVHSLMAAAERGESAASFLPVLAAYMGHKDITTAEYYLHLTAEAQDAVIDKMLSAYGGTIYKELEDEDDH